MHYVLIGSEIALIVLLLLASAFYIWLLLDSIANHGKNRIIYVSSSLKPCMPVIEACISRYVPEPKDVRLIEAGAGQAYVSRYLAAHNVWKEVIAVDISAVRLVFARLGNLRQRAPIRFVTANILDYAYQSGDLVYCYLSPEIMGELYTRKILSECLVFSLSFAIPGITATEEIPVPNWQKELFVYDFRTV